MFDSLFGCIDGMVITQKYQKQGGNNILKLTEIYFFISRKKCKMNYYR